MVMKDRGKGRRKRDTGTSSKLCDLQKNVQDRDRVVTLGSSRPETDKTSEDIEIGVFVKLDNMLICLLTRTTF